MKPAFRLLLALILLGWAGESRSQAIAQGSTRISVTPWSKVIETEISPKHVVVVGDLIGLSPLQVQRRLVGVDVDWPNPMGFEVATSQGVLSFAELEEYLEDAGAIEFSARLRNESDIPPISRSACSNRATPYKHGVLLMFRDGKFAGVWSPRDPVSDTTFYATAGTLPLEDGDAFTSHWGRQLLDERAELTIQCTKTEVQRAPNPPPRSGQEFFSASDMQGLALLPFAVTLPFMNSSRAARQRSGAALYQQLTPGYRLPGGLKGFLLTRSGVDAVRGAAPNYAVLKIDMGGYPTKNLSNFKDFGLVGVRNDVVVWRSLDYSAASPRLPLKRYP